MNALNRSLLNSDFNFNKDLKIGNKNKLTEKVLQFGEGNFLRAFVDYMIDELNSNNLFNGSIALVQPIEHGLIDTVNKQDGLYTLFLRGLENGEEVLEKKIITSVTRGVNPYINFKDYMECAKNPDLRVIVSNTTESGIIYRSGDKLTDEPPISFPAKITAFLYERFKIFEGDKTKGVIFIPCELIDYNGTTLKKYVLQYVEEWNLPKEFTQWLHESNYFTNTLVDRIVTGYPKDEANETCEQLGYADDLLNTAEIFHFWVIEAPKELAEELPFDKIGLNVVWTEDATPYKMRKVRILNGAHTMSALLAYLAGKDTVLQLMQDNDFRNYLKKGLFDEIVPTLDLEYNDLKSFADSVFDRFANPYIKHYLLSISLNSISKYKTRVLPSLLEYIKRKNELPAILTFSFASLIAFYKGTEISDNALLGIRNGESYKIQDDSKVLEFFQDQWKNWSNDYESTERLVKLVCANTNFWGLDLNNLDGFTKSVSETLYALLTTDVCEQLKNLIKE